MLCAVGDLVEDVVVRLAGAPERGTDVSARISRHRGGSAANVAAAAVHAGATARFVGQVGDDDTGARVVAALVDAGVELAVRRAGRTGTIVVLVDPDGERTFLTDRGACTELDGYDPAWLDGVELLHVPAYSLVQGPLAATARDMVRGAHDRAAAVSVDTSSTSALRGFGADAFLALVDELRPAVLFASSDEAELLHLSREHPPAGVGLLVLRRGADPTVVCSAGRRLEVRVPSGPVTDTTGAGDAFAAGFLVSWLAGADPQDAAHAGHRLAADVIARAGADLPRNG